MSIIEHILNIKQPVIFRQFLLLKKRTLSFVQPPQDAEDAMQLGYRLGLQAGYGEGLVEGVDLGMDVASTLAASPVISSPELWDIC